MKNFSNKFNFILGEKINDGLSLWDFFTKTSAIHDEIHIVVNNFGSRLSFKVAKKEKCIIFSSRGKKARNRLSMKDIRLIVNEKTLDYKFKFNGSIIMSMTIEPNMVRLDIE